MGRRTITMLVLAVVNALASGLNFYLAFTGEPNSMDVINIGVGIFSAAVALFVLFKGLPAAYWLDKNGY